MIGIPSNGVGWLQEPRLRTGDQPLVPGFVTRRILGVDLGQSSDPSTAVELTQRVYDPGFIGPKDERIKAIPRTWKLGTDYCQLERDLLDYCVDVMVVEYNGVGRPVVDHLRQAARDRGWKGHIRPCVTAASNVRQKTVLEESGFHFVVPKPEYISSINLARETHGLVFPECPESHILMEEMRTFKRLRQTNRTVQHGNAPGAGNHDDLVIAFGLACWWLTRFGNRKLRILV